MQLFKTSANYTAFNHPKAGIVVHSKGGTAGGVNLQPSHPQYSAYLEALTTAIDSQEADALCKALLS